MQNAECKMNCLNSLRDLIWPRKCILCGRLMGPQGDRLCAACAASLPEPISGARRGSHYKRWASALWYEGPFRASFHRFKFGGCRFYAGVYGPWLAEAIRTRLGTDYDLMTFVPISARRRWRRGYDQTLLLAREAGARLDLPPTATLRKRHRPPQSQTLRRADRQTNIQGAFTVPDPAKVRGKRILLIDDVMTTGATVTEAAQALQSAGAKSIDFRDN